VGQDHRARDFQRNQFVTVIEEIGRMRENTRTVNRLCRNSKRNCRYFKMTVLSCVEKYFERCGAWRELEAFLWGLLYQ
jgi:hypothetical protein